MTDLDGRLPEHFEEIFEDLRSTLLVPPTEWVTEQHLDRMAHATIAEGEPIPFAPRHKARVMAAAVFGAAVLVGGGIAAAAGELPGPLQDVVSRVFEPLGADIPHSEPEPASVPHSDTSEREANGTDRTGSTTTTQVGSVPPGVTEEPPAGAADGGGDPSTIGDTPSSPSGQSGSTPGQSGSTPGQSGSSPGQSIDPPGQPSIPDDRENAPGETREPNGRSDTAPGHSDNSSNEPASPPGQSP